MPSGGSHTGNGSLNVTCPQCGGNLHDSPNRIQCHGCDFVLWRVMASRQFSTSELQELISTGRSGPFQDFRSKTGKRFAALLKLTPALKVEFDFGLHVWQAEPK
jgi:DNA topoisomerase-3